MGRFLGPKGLMPSERRGTVTDDVLTYIRRLKGSSEWKGDKAGVIRTPIAKVRLDLAYISPHSFLIFVISAR